MKKTTFLTWFYRVSSGLLAVSYLLVMVTLARLNILPLAYFIGLCVVTLPVIAWLSLRIFKPTTAPRKRAIGAGAALILSAISLYAFVSLFATASFLTGLEQSGSFYDSYSVIAKKERHIALKQAATANTIDGDVNATAVNSEVSKLTPAKQSSVNTLIDLKTNLNNASADLGVMRDSQLELIKESDKAYYDTVEVLATFKVKFSSKAASNIDASKPFALYISGIDTYGEIASVSRSDVNMLVIVNPQQHKILLVNTPRDYYVQLAGTTGQRDKLTHAGIYGIDTSTKTLENLYGIDINSYARVNFSSLISIVDTLGGISVYSDYDFNSFHQGYNDLNGKRALEFARERYSFSEGDRTRGQNQQRVIEAIVKKLESPAVLTNYTSLLSTLRSSLQTNMPGDVITTLVNKQLQTLSKWSVQSISVDGAGKLAPTYSMGAQPLYVMEPDTASVDRAKAKIADYLAQ